MANADLKNAFLAFANYGTREPTFDLDGRSFVKLCKDSGLVAKNFTTTDVDLIFAKVKDGPHAKKINFERFLMAAHQIAAKKGCSPDEVMAKVIGANPTTNATQADYVKFHDDKSTYTGVYAKGGPTNVDKDRAAGLAGLLDRSPADVRGIKINS